MSKNVAMFVDVANLYYAARGQEVDVDYVALLNYATKGRDLIRAYAYSGLDPENENQRKFIDFLGKNGYKVVTKDIRKFGDGRVKANLDIELVVDLFKLRDRMDIAVIISGDGDFAPAIRALQDGGVRCEVISFRPNTSSDLIAVADEFVDIMKIIGIGRGKDEGDDKTERTGRGMSSPEMPAKEHVPEFGFRDASPAVAAAALAALRSGEPRGGASRRGGRRAAAPPITAPPAVDAEASAIAQGEASAAEATGEVATAGIENGDARRRRRRRGGRGRGRGRTTEAGIEQPAGEDGAWQEFDDLSELSGLDEEREYTFEEADPETLAELGLLDAAPAQAPAEASDASGMPEDVGAEAAPKPRRRTTRSRATAVPEPNAGTDAARAPVEQTAAPVDADAKPARRRGTRGNAATASSEDSAEKKPARRGRAKASVDETKAAPEAAAPARSRGRRKASEGGTDDRLPRSAEGKSAEAREPQGIWQRFRSARQDGGGQG